MKVNTNVLIILLTIYILLLTIEMFIGYYFFTIQCPIPIKNTYKSDP